MPSPNEIVDALKDYGLTVVEDRGWRTRGARNANGQLRPFTPYGQAVHHDALSEAVSDEVALRIMREGRVDLAGPLCNGWIDSDSTVYLIAANNANHAGRNERNVHERLKKGLAPLGDARDVPGDDALVGNPYLWGWECRNAGTGRDPWEQLSAMERACAAVADAYAWSSNAIAGHRELTARKIDPAGIDMFAFRADVKKIRFAHDQPKDDDMPNPAVKGNQSSRVYVTDGVYRTYYSSMDKIRQMALTGAVRLNTNGTPFVVDQDTIDSIPDAT